MNWSDFEYKRFSEEFKQDVIKVYANNNNIMPIEHYTTENVYMMSCLGLSELGICSLFGFDNFNGSEKLIEAFNRGLEHREYTKLINGVCLN